MPKIKTKAYGEIEVTDDSHIHFKQAIFGFDSCSDYYLIEMKDLENFYWLQSSEDSDLAFVVVNPRLFKEDYNLDIDNSDRELLELEKDDEVVDMAIVNIPENPADMTINLLGPIVINVKKKIGIQAISIRNDYGTKYRVFSTEEKPHPAETAK